MDGFTDFLLLLAFWWVWTLAFVVFRFSGFRFVSLGFVVCICDPLFVPLGLFCLVRFVVLCLKVFC